MLPHRVLPSALGSLAALAAATAVVPQIPPPMHLAGLARAAFVQVARDNGVVHAGPDASALRGLRRNTSYE